MRKMEKQTDTGGKGGDYVEQIKFYGQLGTEMDNLMTRNPIAAAYVIDNMQDGGKKDALYGGLAVQLLLIADKHKTDSAQDSRAADVMYKLAEYFTGKCGYLNKTAEPQKG